ncbi:MAG: site-specific integrase [Isosphaera sp.]|nr:site-specific integrase [Isosphaera sp.]
MRQPKPWFRASKNAWYVQYRGKKVPLGAHPEGAPPPKKTKAGWNAPPQVRDAFYKLMASDPANLPKAGEVLACQVCDLFLSHSERHNERATYAWYRHFLQSFCSLYGRLPARELKPIHVTRWLDSTAWKGGRRNAVTAVKRAFNWADQQGVLSPNPLRTVQKPPPTRRTRVVSPAERAEVLAAVKDRNFREYLTALYLTGCRPSEVARVTAGEVNLDLGVWVLEAHKTAKRTGKPRVVYLSPEMVELSRRLAAERPEGPLFPSRKLGRPFSKNAIRIRFRRLRERLPHLKGVVAYAYRHAFASDALANGVGIAQVAELLGHTDTRMVSRHYAHLDQKAAHMREAARKATGG